MAYYPNLPPGQAAMAASAPVVISSDQTAIPVNTNTAALGNGATALTPKFAIIDHAASGDNTIIAAVAAKKLLILQFAFVVSAAVTVRFEDGAAGTALTGQMQFAANSGMNSGFSPVGHFKTSTNTLLNMELSGATSVDGWIIYVETT